MSAEPGSVLMLQGTASSVGKSLLTAALCRILAREGLRVAPFKAQNMSNNSFVTADGRELGRAQAVQAEAAGIEPLAEMNPILLKPEADHRSQVVVLGRPCGVLHGHDFLTRKQELWPVVTESLARLRADFDVVLIEGAGSPAEINLRAGDIVNMRVARHAQAPVLLVGDIDRGGVFAHLVGTLALLEPEERELVQGLVINKFRGSAELLQPGVAWLERRTGLPVAGVVPWLDGVGVADEDAVALEGRREQKRAALDVAVIRFPRIANFDDLDPLAAETGVSVRFVSEVSAFGTPNLLVLPGTKSTIADLDWLRRSGLAAAVLAHAEAGGAVIGICGGYQMLGERVLDPGRVESEAGEAPGLALLPAVTEFEPAKATHRVRATLSCDHGLFALLNGAEVGGYEIHMGQSRSAVPALHIRSRSGVPCDDADGAVNAAGNVFGTYLHGLFDNDNLRATLLRSLSGAGEAEAFAPSVWDRRAAYNRLADHVAAALDMRLVHRLLRLG
ncbi:MAG TPA: cobyric acid synthase [Dehalococcoidia bacterium]|nr:cobyric acid synthase [Dehalococcoidia bacterium]